MWPFKSRSEEKIEAVRGTGTGANGYDSTADVDRRVQEALGRTTEKTLLQDIDLSLFEGTFQPVLFRVRDLRGDATATVLSDGELSVFDKRSQTRVTTSRAERLTRLMTSRPDGRTPAYSFYMDLVYDLIRYGFFLLYRVPSEPRDETLIFHRFDPGTVRRAWIRDGQEGFYGTLVTRDREKVTVPLSQAVFGRKATQGSYGGDRFMLPQPPLYALLPTLKLLQTAEERIYQGLMRGGAAASRATFETDGNKLARSGGTVDVQDPKSIKDTIESNIASGKPTVTGGGKADIPL